MRLKWLREYEIFKYWYIRSSNLLVIMKSITNIRNIFLDCFIQMSDSRSFLHRAIYYECFLTRPNSRAMLLWSVTSHRRHADNVDDAERLALSRNVRRKLSVSGIPRGRPFYHSTKCFSIPFPNIARNRAWKYLHAYRYTRRSICDSYARIYQWRPLMNAPSQC